MRIRRHGGRMRYAPTPVRLWGYAFGLILDEFSWVLWFEFWRMRCCLLVHIVFRCWLNVYSPPWRAYAIRPYTCSVVRVCGRTHFRCVIVGFMVWILANQMLFAAEWKLISSNESIFAAIKGVCDTPLHMFGCELMRLILFQMCFCWFRGLKSVEKL